jgi:adenine deaminase
LFDVLNAACVNPVKHYGLDVGLLQTGDPADFIIVNNLTDFKVLKTYINGELVAENGKSLVKRVEAGIVNNFNTSPKQPMDFEIELEDDSAPVIRVIEARDGQLITSELHEPGESYNSRLVSNTDNDVLKITVVERYGGSKPAVAFIRNFGLTKGAIASCVAHDSHNIIAAGVSDEDICSAVNAIIENKGGISVVSDGKVDVLPLPVAGIMTNEDGYKVAGQYTRLDAKAKELGTKLSAPFMTLSFMALLVIPQLKLSDKGLFDGKQFKFVDLIV